MLLSSPIDHWPQYFKTLNTFPIVKVFNMYTIEAPEFSLGLIISKPTNILSTIALCTNSSHQTCNLPTSGSSLTTMDPAVVANANAAPEQALSWLAVTTLVVAGIFLGRRALCRPSVSLEQFTDLMRAAQETVTVTRYHPTIVIHAPARTITHFSWSHAVELGPQVRQLAASVPWKFVAHLVVGYLGLVLLCLGVAWWLRRKGRNPDQRLASARPLCLNRIRKRPEGLGPWSVSTDDILDLPY